jgi:protocatechuate 3,4-dioxygenase beta subunit
MRVSASWKELSAARMPLATSRRRSRAGGAKLITAMLSTVTLGAVLSLPMASASPATLTVSNATTSGTANTAITLTSSGGGGTGAVTFTATGTGCSVNNTTHTLKATAVTTCNVKAVKAASTGYAKQTSAGVDFTFVAADQATLTVTANKTSTTVSGSATVSPHGGSGGGAVTYAVSGDHCSINNTTRVVTATAPTVCTVTATKAAKAGYASATSAGVAITFVPNTYQITNTLLHGNVGDTIQVTAAGGTATGTPTYFVTGTGCSIGSSTGVLSASATASCSVTVKRIAAGSVKATSPAVVFTFNPAATVAKPDVATLTTLTGAGTKIDATADGQGWITQYYNANDHWYGYFMENGATITMTWHVVDGNGAPLTKAPVTLLSNLDYSNAHGVSWTTSSLNVYGQSYPSPTGTLAGTTDMNGNVSFTLTNTNGDYGTAPTNTTTSSSMQASEGPLSFTTMLLQVGGDGWAGDPTSNVTQATDRVDIIVKPYTCATTPVATHGCPNLATNTAVTNTVNTAPLDLTYMGDIWFIWAYYSPTDKWMFNYVTPGSTFTLTWHVVDHAGHAMSNTLVTLMTQFAPGGGSSGATDAAWTATGMDADGNIQGTTDSNGNITFTVKAPTGNPGPAPADLTNEWTALGMESTNAWSRMALIIGTPVPTNKAGGYPDADGARGSATYVVSANGSAVGDVNQATDLVDMIVIPAT